MCRTILPIEWHAGCGRSAYERGAWDIPSSMQFGLHGLREFSEDLSQDFFLLTTLL